MDRSVTEPGNVNGEDLSEPRTGLGQVVHGVTELEPDLNSLCFRGFYGIKMLAFRVLAVAIGV